MEVIAKHRPTRAIISKKAIHHNIQEEIKRLDEGTELWAVIKADAYGHGALEVAQVALKAGATGFCVAYVDEAIALRKAGITAPILVLGVAEPMATVCLAAQYDISLAAASLDWLERAEVSLAKAGLHLKVHLAIDTGMGRIGMFAPEELKATKAFLAKVDHLQAEGIFTHFATADEKDAQYFALQQKRFEEALAILGDDFRYIHTSNTATALWHGAWHSNVVRFGVGIYGLNPSGSVISDLPYELQPAMRLESEIVYIKKQPKGRSVSYGATYTSQEDEYIATLPIGYADGFLRAYSGFSVLVDGQRMPIVGRVTMDQIMIRLPKYYPVGTKVTLIGKDGAEEITFTEAADYIGTINYELTCILGQRLLRVYEEN